MQDLSRPLLGLFGNDDRAPSPEQVNQMGQFLSITDCRECGRATIYPHFAILARPDVELVVLSFRLSRG